MLARQSEIELATGHDLDGDVYMPVDLVSV
jgi:hypothetical protein